MRKHSDSHKSKAQNEHVNESWIHVWLLWFSRELSLWIGERSDFSCSLLRSRNDIKIDESSKYVYVDNNDIT